MRALIRAALLGGALAVGAVGCGSPGPAPRSEAEDEQRRQQVAGEEKSAQKADEARRPGDD